MSTGAFILNSGVGKLSVGPERASLLHGMASHAFPMFSRWKPERFTTALGAGEVALGAALVAPVVPPIVAGTLLTAFSAGLLRIYWKTPGMRELGSFRPTPQGTAISKDVWMLGAGLALTIDALTSGGRRKRNRAKSEKGAATQN
jgi:hypothetical protein